MKNDLKDRIFKAGEKLQSLIPNWMDDMGSRQDEVFYKMANSYYDIVKENFINLENLKKEKEEKEDWFSILSSYDLIYSLYYYIDCYQDEEEIYKCYSHIHLEELLKTIEDFLSNKELVDNCVKKIKEEWERLI